MYALAIGTYTRRESFVDGTAAGMYLARVDPRSGALSVYETVTGLVNPSYVAAAPDGRALYAVNEGADRVSAFALDPGSRTATPLNSQSSHGAGPTHLAVHPAGQHLLVANYGGGSIAVLPVLADGRIGAASDIVTLHGRGANPARQASPHAHMITTGPNGRIYAVDLGTDRIWMYELDRTLGKLYPATRPWLALPPGSGPRHLAFHPGGQFAYVVTELDNTVVVIALEGDDAQRVIQTAALLPPDFTGASAAAAIRVAPSGRHVYASNRGHDSIAVFAVRAGGSRLEPSGHVSTLGRAPRDFGISPDGRFLLAANQDSSTIVTLAVDPVSGQPAPTGMVAAVDTPVCLTWIRPFGVK